MKTKTLLCLALPLSLVTGCIRSHREPTAVYLTPAPPPTPTSERAEPRVYAAPPGVESGDVAIADSVSQLLKGDTGFGPAGAAQNVTATVHHGVVTLHGNVPSEHDRTEIAERVGKLPGVVAVHDDIGVELR